MHSLAETMAKCVSSLPGQEALEKLCVFASGFDKLCRKKFSESGGMKSS